MRIRLIILSLTIGSILTSHAQNLVPNPSFEIFTQCPTNPGQVSFAAPWTDPNNGSSDYFNVCGNVTFGVPANSAGYQSARTGNAYAGLNVYYSDIPELREYLQVQLSSTLQSSKNYAVEFYVSLIDSSSVAANLSLYFSDTAISETLAHVLNVSPQIVNDMVANPLTEKIGWTRISGTYTATGNENYITIGSFVDDANTDTIMISGSYPFSYYYLDDVSVVCMDCDATTIHEESGALDLNIYPNPAQNSVNINYGLLTEKNAMLTIYDFTGKLILSQGLSAQQENLILSTENLSSGIYLCSLTTDNAVISSKKLVVSR